MASKMPIPSLFVLLLSLLFLTSCALSPKPQNAEDWVAAKPGVATNEQTSSRESKPVDVRNELSKHNGEETDADSLDDESPPSVAHIENLTIDDVLRVEEPNTQTLYDDSRYDFPITVNARVEAWIDYFTGRGRDHMERYLARSSRYIPVMRKIFKEEGLPEDLVYLALIESGFNLRAKSRARAVGPWQFIKSTGKRYGLKVDAWIDERRDPIRSTQAAAKYLKDLYLMFESWYLAASAYNAGEYKIMRAIESTKTNNYWRISETRQIRRETKDYIPKLIAAAIIGKNPNRYGFGEITYQEPLKFDTVTVDHPVRLKDLARLVETSEEEITDLNPQLRREMIPPGSGLFELRVPHGTRVLVEKAMLSYGKNYPKSDLPRQIDIKSGDTLAQIARRYRVRSRDLAHVNNLNPREALIPGGRLLLPDSAAKKPLAEEVVPLLTSKDKEEIAGAALNYTTHVVQRGESLWSISEQYNITVQDIFRWNNLKNSRIHPGTKLKVKSDLGSRAKQLKSSHVRLTHNTKRRRTRTD